MSEATVFVSHDHQSCISQALSKAQLICATRKVRLTSIRLQILRYIWESHKPTGAYELLARINSNGRNAAPPTVYRALDFLLELGLIHRIASLNAFIGCVCPEYGHQGSFLICHQCHSAHEMNQQSVDKAIHDAAIEEGFSVEGVILEINGLCPACREVV
jgi:Fur family zinc uptake transcriptional regulator